jgi:protein involved in polysaccharide export with SLBB domain
MHNWLRCIFVVFIVSILINCLYVNLLNNSHAQASVISENSLNEENHEYILQVGDIIDIKFFYNPELNEQVTIRPDGRISLQIIDAVQAAGLTPSVLDDILTEKYSTILRTAEITIIVKKVAGQKIYVGGEVNSPGVIRILGSLTTLQAIFQAGGFKNTAELKNVVILRNRGTQEPLFITINLKEDLKENAKHNDILLKAYDIVYVPKTTIAKLNQFVGQYIEKLIPITKSLGLVYNINPEVEVKQ